MVNSFLQLSKIVSKVPKMPKLKESLRSISLNLIRMIEYQNFSSF